MGIYSGRCITCKSEPDSVARLVFNGRRRYEQVEEGTTQILGNT
jgi:hypothetical protein